MSARIEYAPGEAWCIAAGRVVLVCERDLPAVRARALHDAAAAADSVDALRAILDVEPAALLGLVDLADRRVLVRRHGVPATADDTQLADRFGADWALDETAVDATIAAGALGGLAADVLPLGDGVVRVAAVRVAPRPADPADATTDAGDAVRAEAPAAVEADPEPRTGAFGETLPPRAAAEPWQPEPSVVEPEPEPVPEPEPEPEPELAQPQPQPQLDSAPVAPEPRPAPAPTSFAAPQPPAPAAPRPIETTNPIGGLIDSVPGFIRPAVDVRAAPPTAPAAPVAAPRPAPLADAGDHDGMTITAEQARRLQEERERAAAEPLPQQSAVPAAPATGPLVLSTLCPNGHVNAPATRECARCGAPIDDGSAAQRPRPEVAVAVLPSGERVPLGRGVVLGRRPRSRRAEDGRVPRLVTVESPGEDISRSHLELRVDDWNLVAIDLSSTNGTLLLRDGAAPQRLRPEAPTILQLGDRVDLGEGVVITIEAAP